MSLADTPVATDEILARFILFSKWIRTSDNTIRPEAFIPHPYVDLSVTRHGDLLEKELWQLGENVAESRKSNLYGRADIRAEFVIINNLTVEPSEPPRNHANIKGYPVDKSAQKLIALQLAADSVFISA